MDQVQEDVTCSICLDVLDDPVSIECSHNFCQGCLVAHWRGVLAQGYQCPECRTPCSRDRMTPDTRLRALVKKITEPLREEMELQGPGAQPEPGRPVQLVRLDDKGSLILYEEALSLCLEQGGVGDAPVLPGVHHRGAAPGKILPDELPAAPAPEPGEWGQEPQLWPHRLNQRSHPPQPGACLQPACPGPAPGSRAAEEPGMGRGEGGVSAGHSSLWLVDLSVCLSLQVAMFLVDTEGSLDLQRRMETSIKLSVLGILLSSYWIFNISSTFKQTEADYLEMFIQVAKEVGGTCNLAPIQRLDLLVRDWQLSGAYGADAGQEWRNHR
ncbi:RING finger protein 112-like [Chrysemys picta bellii]|uniref:RING finger protein 112-like n=1 Tax=Chrysemys picta bellii TaxID=8478 RepID=UPI0032B1EF83